MLRRARSPGRTSKLCRLVPGPAKGDQASRTQPRTRLREMFDTKTVDVVGSVSRTDLGTVRRTANDVGFGASRESSTASTMTVPIQIHGTSRLCIRNAGMAPNSANAALQPVTYIWLARHRHRSQHGSEHDLGRNALKLRLGTHLDAVSERPNRERLDIVGSHKGATA